MKNGILRQLGNAAERANKALWYSVVFPLIFPGRGKAPALADVHRLLVIRADAIGDMILTTPVFRALKALNPSLRLWVAASRRNAEVIAADRDVEKVVILTEKDKIQWSVVRELRVFHPQVIMNCVTNRTTKYGVLARLIARNSYTVALDHPERPEYGKLFSRLIEVPDMYSRHYSEIMLEFVRRTFGVACAAENYLPHIAIEDKYITEANTFLQFYGIKKHTGLLLNLSAGQPRKRWSEEKYGALVGMLLRQYDAIVLTAAPEDREKADRIANRSRANVHVFRAENIRALAAIAAQCAMVITPDTSLVHVAAAVKAPVVAWYPTAENVIAQWLPSGVPYRVVYAEGYNAEAVSPDDVFANVQELFSALAL